MIRTTTAVLIAAMALIVAACGGSDGGGSEPIKSRQGDRHDQRLGVGQRGRDPRRDDQAVRGREPGHEGQRDRRPGRRRPRQDPHQRRRQPGAGRGDGRHDLDGRARAHADARRGARPASTSRSSSRARPTPSRSTARPTACRGTSRRGSSTTAPTSPRRPASPRRPRRGTSSRRRRARCRTRAARSTASTSPPTTGRSTCRSCGRPAATSPRATSSRSTRPQGAEATGFYKSFADEGLSPNTTKQGFDITPAFVRGTHPMFFSGPWHMGLVNEAGGKGFDKKWAVAPMPTKADQHELRRRQQLGRVQVAPRTATRRGSSSSGCPSPRRRPSGTRSPATCRPTRPRGICPRCPRTRT